MKLIHLSDTHIGRDDNVVRMERLITDIVSLGNPQDFLVVHTGDLNDTHSLDNMDLGRTVLQRLSRQE